MVPEPQNEDEENAPRPDSELLINEIAPSVDGQWTERRSRNYSQAVLIKLILMAAFCGVVGRFALWNYK